MYMILSGDWGFITDADRPCVKRVAEELEENLSKETPAISLGQLALVIDAGQKYFEDKTNGRK